jgi:hypothetical protein
VPAVGGPPHALELHGEFWTDDWNYYDESAKDTRFEFRATFTRYENPSDFWQP